MKKCLKTGMNSRCKTSGYPPLEYKTVAMMVNVIVVSLFHALHFVQEKNKVIVPKCTFKKDLNRYSGEPRGSRASI